MPRFECPQCENEIDYLNTMDTCTVYGTTTLQVAVHTGGRDAQPTLTGAMNSFEIDEYGEEHGDSETRCPECDDYISASELIIRWDDNELEEFLRQRGQANESLNRRRGASVLSPNFGTEQRIHDSRPSVTGDTSLIQQDDPNRLSGIRVCSCGAVYDVPEPEICNRCDSPLSNTPLPF